MPLYGSSKYWEAHYQDDDDETYDWLLPFSALRSVLVEYGGCQSLGLRSRLATLIVGCGKSELCEQMYDAGWKTMTAVDISGTVIRHMEQRKYDRRGKPIRRGLTFEVRDACNLPSPQYDEQFDLVIDKSTLDAMLCSRGESILIVDKYLRSIYRTLKFGGTYIAVSLGPPKRRLSKLKREGLKWHIQVIEIPKPDMDEFNVRSDDERYVYVYVAQKEERTAFKVAAIKEDMEAEEVPVYDPDKETVYQWPGEVVAARKRVLVALKQKLLPCNAPIASEDIATARKRVILALKQKLLPCNAPVAPAGPSRLGGLALPSEDGGPN